MGEAGNRQVYVDLDQALDEEDLSYAWQGAHERAYIHLHQALRLTILMARLEAPKYEAAARKFLIRYIRETKPSFGLLIEVAKALEELPDLTVYPTGEGPEYELKELARAMEKAQKDRKDPPGIETAPRRRSEGPWCNHRANW
jgi:hypothetical protein